MPLLPLPRVPLSDYWRVAEGADAKGVSLSEHVQHIWNLGLAASTAAEQPQEVNDPQLVTAVGAAEGANP